MYVMWNSYTKRVKISKSANPPPKKKTIEAFSQTGSYEDVSHLAIPPRVM